MLHVYQCDLHYYTLQRCIQVSGGFCDDEDEAEQLCQKLAGSLNSACPLSVGMPHTLPQPPA